MYFKRHIKVKFKLQKLFITKSCLQFTRKTDVRNICPAVDKFTSDMPSVRSQRSVRVNNRKHMVR